MRPSRRGKGQSSRETLLSVEIYCSPSSRPNKGSPSRDSPLLPPGQCEDGDSPFFAQTPPHMYGAGITLPALVEHAPGVRAPGRPGARWREDAQVGEEAGRHAGQDGETGVAGQGCGKRAGNGVPSCVPFGHIAGRSSCLVALRDGPRSESAVAGGRGGEALRRGVCSVGGSNAWLLTPIPLGKRRGF